MIDGLVISGAEPTDDGVRVLVGPVVLSLVTSARDGEQLVRGGPRRVQTVLEIDDGRPLLFGFCEEEDRALYGALRALTGIGPRIAIALVGLGPARDLLRAVAAGEAAYLSAAPGVGKARAEKVIAHLRARYAGRLPLELAVPVAAFVEAREGLVSAGLDEDRAEAILTGLGPGPRSAKALLEAGLAVAGTAG